jgi:hypothetical protein
MWTADVVVYTHLVGAFADVIAPVRELGDVANANDFKLKLLPLAHCGLFAAAFVFRLLLLLRGLPIDEAAWSAQSALLQPRFSFAGAPAIESPAGANSAGSSNDARVEIHMLAALQSTNFNDT